MTRFFYRKIVVLAARTEINKGGRRVFGRINKKGFFHSNVLYSTLFPRNFYMVNKLRVEKADN